MRDKEDIYDFSMKYFLSILWENQQLLIMSENKKNFIADDCYDAS